MTEPSEDLPTHCLIVESCDYFLPKTKQDTSLSDGSFQMEACLMFLKMVLMYSALHKTGRGKQSQICTTGGAVGSLSGGNRFILSEQCFDIYLILTLSQQHCGKIEWSAKQSQDN